MKLVFFVILFKSLIMASNVLLPEATVAVVNGIAISEDEFNRKIAKLMPRSFIHSSVSEKKLKIVKDKALKGLIETALLIEYAKSKNITIPSSEVEYMIEQVEKSLGSSDVLKERLSQNGMTFEEFKKGIQKDLVLEKLHKQEIEYLLTDKDLREYYDNNMKKFKEPEKIKIRIIYVRNDPTDPKGRSKAKEKIEEAAAELENGENFQFVAQNYSNDPSRVKGGDLGYLHKGMLDIALEEQAFSMDANTTSGIIEKDIGFYIVKVEEKKKQNQLEFETIKKKLKVDLKRKKEDDRKKNLLEKLFSTAVIIK